MLRFSHLFAVAGLCGLYAVPVHAAPPRATDDLVRADRATLDALYAAGTPSLPPSGFVPGRAIPEPGSRNTVRRSKVIGLLWKGKVFSDAQMINRLAGGLEAVTARMYVGESLFDGQPSVILDYAGSKRFGDVRDEMREIAPGVFLGMTYVRKCPAPKATTYFVLDARQNCCR